MKLKKFIERAEQIEGSQKVLAAKIGISEANIRAAKSGARGLPLYACSKIAEIIGNDEKEIVEAALNAASELVIEKKPERIAHWIKTLAEFEKVAWKYLGDQTAGQTTLKQGKNKIKEIIKPKAKK